MHALAKKQVWKGGPFSSEHIESGLLRGTAPTWQIVAKRSMAHKLTKVNLIYLGLTVLPLLALSQWTTGSEEIKEASNSMQTAFKKME
jgi:hypothetical protein